MSYLSNTLRSLCIVGLGLTASGAAASTIISDSFESPDIGSGWKVYQSFGNWSTIGGAGIEIQNNVVTSSHDGDQHVELDSHNGNGGTMGVSTNSTMTHNTTLTAGNYFLEWYFKPRTSRSDDNIIEVYLSNRTTNSVFDVLIGSANGTAPEDWRRVTHSFTVGNSGEDFALTFSANGDSNRHGGLIDMVTLTKLPNNANPPAVPLPAGLPLLLLGLTGLGVAKARKKS